MQGKKKNYRLEIKSLTRFSIYLLKKKKKKKPPNFYVFSLYVLFVKTLTYQDIRTKRLIFYLLQYA